MNTELFASLLENDPPEVITVAHNQDEHRSFIDGGDRLGWHMDQAPESLDDALQNLEMLMEFMGWELPGDEEWGYDEEHPEIWLADFVKTDG
jgi:hypothetical protein